MQITIFSTDLVHVIDSLGISSAIYDCGDTVRRVYVTLPLQQLFRLDPQRELLERELDRLAVDLSVRLRTRQTRTASTDVDTLRRETYGEQGSYRFQATRLASTAGSGSSCVLLLTIEPLPGDPLAEKALRQRFRLTRREAELARLLVEGKTNAEIADELGISPNTAHHYTERVMLKLGVRNRVEVGAKILLEQPV